VVEVVLVLAYPPVINITWYKLAEFGEIVSLYFDNNILGKLFSDMARVKDKMISFPIQVNFQKIFI
jgi:hypothetical protein